MRVALLDTNTGALVSSWHPSSIDSSVNKLVLSHGRLYVGGAFTTVGNATHKGLVALAPTTGKVTSYVGLSFTGHHNYDRLCKPSKTNKCAKGVPGVRGLDVNPNGTRMVVTGNFVNVSGRPRDQVAMLDLTKTHARVDQQWATLAYTAECFANGYDSYIRDVQFAPSGSYFVIVATGGIGRNSDHTKSSCDSAARYETNKHGSDVRPTWIDYTGEDSLWTVSITGTTVYVGGHQRWLNNPGENVAGPGAIPRPGIAALCPTNGLPYTWDPGRNPRGAGCYALLATSKGLWIGSDTDYIGNRQYLRPKVAFFPLVGGRSIPAETTPGLPGWVYEVGATGHSVPDPDRLAYHSIKRKAVGSEATLNTGLSWGSVRGAFTVDGHIIYGRPDGNLYERSFNGSTFGSETELDPYNDPKWNNVATGSGQTYQSSPSTFSTEIPTLTSMFFTKGRLYYTLAGDSSMHWRWFEPQSGVVGMGEHTVSDRMNWSNIAGAFFTHHTVYFASQATGKLMSIAWSRKGATGHPKVVDSSKDWASRGLFVLSRSHNRPPPPPPAKKKRIHFVAAAAATGHGSKLKVRVPHTVKKGDALLLFAAQASGKARAHVPRGWKLIGRTHHHGLATAVFDRVARPHDSTSTVVVKSSHAARSKVMIAAYRHAAAKPVERFSSLVGGSGRKHGGPTLHRLRKGSWVVGYWTAAAGPKLSWKAPQGLRTRRAVHRPRHPVLTALLADTAGPTRGTFRPGSARSNRPSRSSAAWAVALSPVGG
jgi:hypothetical protein